MSRHPSKRSLINPFIVMDIMALANEHQHQGGDIIHMEVGQPSTPAPSAALKAVERALHEDVLGYTEACGLSKLRERISRHYADTCSVDIAPERIVVTMGSSAAFILAFLLCFEQGDAVALPSPGYPCYRNIMTALGMTPVDLALKADHRWMPRSDDLQAAVRNDHVQGLILASPANPTGTMLSSDALAALVQTSQEHNVWFISDEIYHGLTYEMSAETALQFSNDVIVINSFSKYFSMTGWRIGWMVVPEYLIRPVERLAQNLFISPPTISQIAALGAFEAREELENHKKAYQRNRDMLLEELHTAGFRDILPADGAFYLYANISAFSDDSVGFVKKMLTDIGVATTPGVDFDPERGAHYVRFCYAQDFHSMHTAAKRIQGWVKSF